jgi:hypothetical protein
MSKWISFVKEYCSKNNISYATALKDPECSKLYKEVNGGALKGSDKNKDTDILNYSDPDKVWKNAIKYLKKDIVIALSTKKNKKYMVRRPDGIWVHFGEMKFKDFTLTRDKEKQRLFKLRNAKWAKQDKYTPGWLAYHLLWT